MGFPRKLTMLVLRHRVAVVVVLIVITAVLGFQLRLMNFGQNEREEILGDDPAIRDLMAFHRTFGDDEIVVVALDTERVFTNEVLAYVRRLTALLEQVKGVRRVVSLTNTMRLEGSGGLLDTQPFLGELPLDEATLRRKEREALADHFWVGDLISKDGKVAAVHAIIPALADDVLRRFQVVADVRRIVRENPQEGVRAYITGVSPIMTDALDSVKQDLWIFLGVTPALVSVLLVVVFRTLRGVVLPMVVINVMMVWTLGLFFSAGRSLTMVTAMLPTLVSIICLSDAIHIMARYYELAAESDDRREVVLQTMEHMLPACFLTSVTTAIGFGSLAVSEFKSIREFGVSAALGILLAYVLAMTVMPIVLSVLPLPGARAQERYGGLFSARLLRRVGRFVRRDRLWTPVGTAVLAVASAIGILWLKVDVDILANMPRGAPAVRGQGFIQDRMAGFQSLELLISAPPAALKQPWALKEIDELQSLVASLEPIRKVTSAVDLVRAFDRAVGGDGTLREPGRVDEFLLLLSMTDSPGLLRAFATPDFSTVRISARIRPMGTSDYLRVLRQIDAFADEHLDPRLTCRTTGLVKLWATKVEVLIRSLMRSLAVTIGIIGVLMAIYLRSPWAAAVCMVPNLVPAAVTLGFMGAIGVPLMVATATIICIAIGIAVDDTIHFVTRYRAERMAGHDLDAAAEHTLASSGRAIIFTSVVIAAGFLLFVLSRFGVIRWFGALTAFTMVVALAGDLLLLPYLLLRLRIGRRWKR